MQLEGPKKKHVYTTYRDCLNDRHYVAKVSKVFIVEICAKKGGWQENLLCGSFAGIPFKWISTCNFVRDIFVAWMFCVIAP